MNAKDALVEIKKLLFSEAEKEAAFALVEGKLVDGTAVAYDLEAGDIFVIGEDGVQIPAPVGEHQLESGEIVVVLEEGKIAEVKQAEAKIEVEIEASAEEVPAEEEPKKDEAMAKVEQAMGDLEKKVEELTAKVKAMEEKAEEVKEAVKMSAVVLESLAKEPSDKPITSPNQFAKQLKVEKVDRYNSLQSAFQKLKQK
jgi:NADH dehydrogenase/NADH:ubiquinone oxidoreductase subunit G